MKGRILVVEDDPSILRGLQLNLGMEGYTVRSAMEGETGLHLARTERPDLVVLDVMLPGMDGWAVCREMRARSNVPILMLTALGEEVDRILGLELGADDYLTKPFSSRELLARIRALLRRVELDRARQPADQQVCVGQVTLDLVTRRVTRAGRELTLRYKEFELLSLLMSHRGEVVTRAELFDQVWGTDWLGDTRTLDVHIRWLREKIEADPGQPHYIQTVRNVGYRFATPEEVAEDAP